jgi:hypothetical protein
VWAALFLFELTLGYNSGDGKKLRVISGGGAFAGGARGSGKFVGLAAALPAG